MPGQNAGSLAAQEVAVLSLVCSLFLVKSNKEEFQMRNLKRVLSLALAALMLMGMMVVGAGAASKDFTDASEIKNVEAVDVMVALDRKSVV